MGKALGRTDTIALVLRVCCPDGGTSFADNPSTLGFFDRGASRPDAFLYATDFAEASFGIFVPKTSTPHDLRICEAFPGQILQAGIAVQSTGSGDEVGVDVTDGIVGVPGPMLGWKCTRPAGHVAVLDFPLLVVGCLFIEKLCLDNSAQCFECSQGDQCAG